jgi:hypothetical protein
MKTNRNPATMIGEDKTWTLCKTDARGTYHVWNFAIRACNPSMIEIVETWMPVRGYNVNGVAGTYTLEAGRVKWASLRAAGYKSDGEVADRKAVLAALHA